MKYSLTWDLDSFFEGGSSSPDLQDKIKSIQDGLKDFESAANNWNPERDKPEYSDLKDLLHYEEQYTKALMQCNSFITGIQSADVSDLNASAIHARIIQLYSKLTIIQTTLKKKITAIEENDWTLLVKMPAFSALAFALSEWRQQGSRLLSDKEEALLANLRVDGFNGWSAHYDTLVSFIKIPFEEADGTLNELSAGQAMNRMYADPDPSVRRKIFVEWEKAWGYLAPAFADTLNHLQGFRLADFEAHQDEDFLVEPLRYNRIKRETLDTMWQAISANKQPFLSFLDRKAALMGKDRLAWYDVDAPVSLGSFQSKTFSFDEAVDYIIEHFASFGPKLADFSLDAVKNRWVEAENRSGKRPGGYCEDYPESKESRIFMTFTGSASDMSTLAHELGHAFHSHVMRDLPDLNTRYAMNVAETASTFAETIISAAT
ncbi:MAG TPA: M3 family metallopeptidase, partial [Trichococcus flocculiformis]|nr:M3 family metallopeptidase [Trichococcus flocculiformis]